MVYVNDKMVTLGFTFKGGVAKVEFIITFAPKPQSFNAVNEIVFFHGLSR